MWSFAFKTLLSDRGKFITALVGVIFSVVLVNIQGGLFIGLIRKASLLVDQADADIWVGHKEMTNADFAHDIPRGWVHRIRSIPGVKLAEPYQVGHTVMTLPSGGFEDVLVVGCDASSQLGGPSRVLGHNSHLIRQTDGVIIDVDDAHKMGNPRLGDIREIGGQRAKIVGFSQGIVGFLVTPYVFTTFERATAYLRKGRGKASYFLVQVEDDANPHQICQQIQSRLPDADVYTRYEYAARSIQYWLRRTGLGISFGASTVLGLIVGLVIIAQTLYASVLDRVAEFGALKAMGASEFQIQSILLTQACCLAFLGSTFGVLIAFVVQRLFSTSRAPITIPEYLFIGSYVLVVVICMLASLLPYLRVRKIDPAIVLQS